jgi:hypothetical protein
VLGVSALNETELSEVSRLCSMKPKLLMKRIFTLILALSKFTNPDQIFQLRYFLIIPSTSTFSKPAFCPGSEYKGFVLFSDINSNFLHIINQLSLKSRSDVFSLGRS